MRIIVVDTTAHESVFVMCEYVVVDFWLILQRKYIFYDSFQRKYVSYNSSACIRIYFTTLSLLPPPPPPLCDHAAVRVDKRMNPRWY